ncbi:MAG: aminotransferase class I/II-fold pyridoxal phosphate-dependent enzyme [Bacteriovoracaceae bacterium]|nr:aminotransferase class I/II-fold pyridoxal phosphate-dependent enzyme [Bacteriovoracaceae bacterium]
MISVNQTVNNFQESIFSTITKLSIENEATNLAQGFPDFDGPAWIIDLAYKAMSEDKKNQYAPSMGILPLRESLSQHYQKYYGVNYDPQKEILVTNGATEAIYLACVSLLNPGDEVIVFAPFYDSYAASIQMAQGQIKVVNLQAPNFSFDEDDLKQQISQKTKMLILNSPHNPTGKIFNKSELAMIARLAKENDFIILSDEVYEFITFEKNFLPISQLEDLRDRLVVISSIGKTLSFTGWKIGWACGPQNLIRAMHLAHQFIVFCVSHPMQVAVAAALPQLEVYLKDLKRDYLEKRNLLTEGLRKRGANILSPEGTYFALCKIGDDYQGSDLDFCFELIKEHKLAAIPMSAFYLNSQVPSRYIRFCFAKNLKTIIEGVAKFPTLKPT